MRILNPAFRLMSTALLLAGLSSVYAQEKQADRQQNETTMTGCLAKDAAGGYTLADEKTGAKIAVTGAAELEKHAANHKVTLTGSRNDGSGKPVFTVTRIQHLAAECKAPMQ